MLEDVMRAARAAAGGVDGYVTVKRAAELVQVHESTVRTWMKEGKLRAYQPAARILRLRLDELHAFMAGQGAGPDDNVVDLDAHAKTLMAKASRRGKKS